MDFRNSHITRLFTMKWIRKVGGGVGLSALHSGILWRKKLKKSKESQRRCLRVCVKSDLQPRNRRRKWPSSQASALCPGSKIILEKRSSQSIFTVSNFLKI